MKKILSAISLLGVAALMLALTVVPVGQAQAGAQNTVAAVASATTVTPSGPDLTAMRAWTKAEMLAAKPYPMPQAKTLAQPSISTTGATGPAGSVAAGGPANSLAQIMGDEVVSEPNVSTLAAYGYPPPFTRQDLRNITSPYNRAPFNKIGKLFFYQNGGSYVCSASVIGNSYTSHAIITAGHCINDGAGHWSYNMVFVPAYNNGNAPYGQWTIIYSTERAFTAWVSGGNLARDVAGAKLNKLGGYTITQKLGWMGFAWNYSRVNAWWQIGYPQASPFTGAWMIACQASYAYDSPFGTTPKPMGVGCDQTGGTSGGPWVLKIGAGDYTNSVQSHRRTGYNNELFGPYFDTAVHDNLWAVLVAP